MNRFQETFLLCDKLTQTENKPIGQMVMKLMTEVGETAENVLITEGYTVNKTIDEPLAGEIADVVNCAISILVRATPHLTPLQRLELFEEQFEKKTLKWERMQKVEKEIAEEKAEEARVQREIGMGIHVPSSPSASSSMLQKEQLVMKTIGEQLGHHPSKIKLDDNFVDDLGADSLDLVELVMAIEDEFDFEILDSDAEALQTPRQVIAYLKENGVIPLQ